MKIWKSKGKSFTAYGIAPFFGIVINKAGIITIKIFNFHFGYSKDLKRFI